MDLARGALEGVRFQRWAVREGGTGISVAIGSGGHDRSGTRAYTFYMERSQLLEHLRKTRFARGDRKRALEDARSISSWLKTTYGAEVIGVGSLFESPRPFRKDSDIDLVVKNLPPEHFFRAYDAVDAMSDFDVELIPWESANELMRDIATRRGVEL